MARRGPAYYQNYARLQARRQGIPESVFLRQLKMEAGWRTNATSHAGAQGIAQIMPFHDVRPDLPGHQRSGRNPEWDIAWAAKHNAQNLKKYGNVRDMLSVYNSGRPWAQAKGITETKNYVSKILGGGPGAVMSGRAGEDISYSPSTPLTGSDTPRDGIRKFLQASLMNYAATGQNLGPMDLYMMNRAQDADVPDEFEETPSTPLGSVGRVGSGRGGITYRPQKSTHQTAGLAGYPAVDLFGKPGTPFLAPESGKVYRHSGRGGTSGPIYGHSLYFRGNSGKDYFITHLGKRAGIGRYRAGQPIGTISPWKSGAPHAHVGVRG
jgi:hypothetical protein